MEGIKHLKEEVKRLRARVLDNQRELSSLRALIAVSIAQGNIAVDVPLSTLRAGVYSSYIAVQIPSDDAGASGWFTRQGVVGLPDDGRNYIKDASGCVFKRQRNE